MRTVTVKNAEAVRAMITQFGASAEKGIEDLVKAAGLDTITDVKHRIENPPKTGAIYKRGSISHQASADGEAPAKDTGTLINSIFFEQPSKLQVKIGSRLNYAFYLEYGTMMMRPRPSWKHAVFDARKRLNKDIDDFIKALTK